MMIEYEFGNTEGTRAAGRYLSGSLQGAEAIR